MSKQVKFPKRKPFQQQGKKNIIKKGYTAASYMNNKKYNIYKDKGKIFLSSPMLITMLKHDAPLRPSPSQVSAFLSYSFSNNDNNNNKNNKKQ